MMWRIEKCCCAAAVLFPKLLSNGIYLWAIYAFCYEVCLQMIGGLSGLILATVGFYLAFQGMYMYMKVINVGAGSPLDFPDLRVEDDDVESNRAPPSYLVENSLMIKGNGKFRFCEKCKCWKPDRCHHCSSCNRCWLKMDHHCPWFATCIGFKNQKYSIQFLVNSVVFGWLCLIVSGYVLYQFFVNEKYNEEYLSLNLIVLAVLGLTVTIAVGLFTGVSLYFLSKNLTTIEYYDYNRYRNNLEIANDSYYGYSKKPSARDLGNVYDLGSIKKNLNIVLGESWTEWLLPIENRASQENFANKGLYFPTNPQVREALVSNSKLQQQLLHELQRSSYTNSRI